MAINKICILVAVLGVMTCQVYGCASSATSDPTVTTVATATTVVTTLAPALCTTCTALTIPAPGTVTAGPPTAAGCLTSSITCTNAAGPSQVIFNGDATLSQPTDTTNVVITCGPDGTYLIPPATTTAITGLTCAP
uniref:C6 domain-containing protein n=1 Tax=Rhabditophanes sp. KR3021 TaxID=114890 RepID=A0AC35TLL1_9BILA